MEEQILSQLINVSKEALQADTAIVWLLNAEGTHLSAGAVSGISKEVLEQ